MLSVLYLQYNCALGLCLKMQSAVSCCTPVKKFNCNVHNRDIMVTVLQLSRVSVEVHLIVKLFETGLCAQTYFAVKAPIN